MGFPTKPSRLAFGPLGLTDRYPVRDPTKEIGFGTFKLAWWQVAGLGIVSKVAKVQLLISGAGAESLGFSAEAWDAEAGILPTLAKQATGHWRITYAATYPDETGAAITTSLSDAESHVQITAAASVFYDTRCQVLASGREVDVFVRAAGGGALTDPINQNIVVDIY